MNTRMVQNSDIVFWNEVVRYKDNKPVYETQKGYYLASYIIHDTAMHIVSCHEITSCVVRHIEDDKLFTDIESAVMACAKLNLGDLFNV